MAIIKKLDTNVGVPASYWKVAITHVDHARKTAWAALYGYPDKATRQIENVAPIHEMTVHLPYESVGSGTLPDFYRAVKTFGALQNVEEDIPEAEQEKDGPTTREVQVPLFADAVDDK